MPSYDLFGASLTDDIDFDPNVVDVLARLARAEYSAATRFIKRPPGAAKRYPLAKRAGDHG